MKADIQRLLMIYRRRARRLTPQIAIAGTLTVVAVAFLLAALIRGVPESATQPVAVRNSATQVQ